MSFYLCSLFFLFNAPAPSEIYTLSLHDALPISAAVRWPQGQLHVRIAQERVLHERQQAVVGDAGDRSEEHTSELQSRFDLVCRLLLEKKKTNSILLRVKF